MSGNSDIKAEQGAPIVAVYILKGAEPEIAVMWKDRMLVSRTDYTLSYKNNKKTADAGAANAPSISIKGKGNFEGLLKDAVKFSIMKQNMTESAANGSLTAICTDMPYIANKGDSYQYRTKIEVYDRGKRLSAGNYTAAYTGNAQADIKEALAAGNAVIIPVTITAKENNANYTGS